mmetsp:Transcript_55808/g.92916  ORF Transcript_55808/g.92916 Transcript_55808/m.92916 type:complete len:213 (-) Transcript_55808:404-1042(-)
MAIDANLAIVVSFLRVGHCRHAACHCNWRCCCCCCFLLLLFCLGIAGCLFDFLSGAMDTIRVLRSDGDRKTIESIGGRLHLLQQSHAIAQHLIHLLHIQLLMHGQRVGGGVLGKLGAIIPQQRMTVLVMAVHERAHHIVVHLQLVDDRLLQNRCKATQLMPLQIGGKRLLSRAHALLVIVASLCSVSISNHKSYDHFEFEFVQRCNFVRKFV